MKCAVQRVCQAACRKWPTSYVNVTHRTHICIHRPQRFPGHHSVRNYISSLETRHNFTEEMTTLLAADRPGLSKVNKSKPSNLRFQCDYLNCQKSYTTKDNLEQHVLSHHQNKRFHCKYPDCQKSYTRKQNLDEHVSGSHHRKGRWVVPDKSGL